MNSIKKVVTIIFLFSLFAIVFVYKDTIAHFFMENFIIKKEIVTTFPNQYQNQNNYLFVQQTDNFFPQNKQDILNIVFTFLNNGWKEFTFYCKNSYPDCQKDIHTIIDDNTLLSEVNNFVNPYNSYQNLYISLNDYGKVTLMIDKLYSEEEINKTNEKLESIKKEILTPAMSTREQILAFHDYIVNHTVYDSEEAKKIENNIINPTLQSHKATNVLQNGIGLCGGYSDVLAIFLDSINVPNYKISNDKHVWNLVKLGEDWFHIDLTWDDPVTANKDNLLIHDFFLITTKQLDDFQTLQHQFNRNVYLEAK